MLWKGKLVSLIEKDPSIYKIAKFTNMHTNIVRVYMVANQYTCQPMCKYSNNLTL